MTDEVVRHVTFYVSQESNKFKTYQLTFQELNELKQKISKSMSQPPINHLRGTRWENSF